VSYANWIPWHGDINQAMTAAKRMGAAYVPQCFGEASPQPRRAENFAHEEWLNVGASLENFGTLNIDRRDREAEQQLIVRHVRTNKPLILVNTIATSSPYPHAATLLAHRWNNRCEVLDLASVRGESICDLLGLYDRALALVTVDTATLHLAAASKVPVVYLKPRGWVASPAKGNCILEQHYDQTDFSAIDRELELLL
jgi:ADP-heptose:LPS heptosyltransferase